MTVAVLNGLQEKRAKQYEVVKALAECEEKTGEWQQKWDQANADYDAILAEIKTVEQQMATAEAVQDRMNTLDQGVRIGEGNGDGAETNDEFNLGLAHAVSGQFARNQVIALQAWLLQNSNQGNLIRDGHRNAAQAVNCNLNSNEFYIRMQPSNEFLAMQARRQTMNQKVSLLRSALNAMQAGVGSTGGFLIGETLLRTIEEAQLDFSGVLQVAELIRTPTGEPMKWPTMDDTANTGTRVGEGQDAGTATDISLGQQIWSAHTFTSGLLSVSRSLLNDAIVDLERIIGEMLGTRLGRKQNTDYTVGAGGGNAPQGIVTGSVVGKTAASATAIVFDELIDLEHSIDPSRRSNGCAYMFNDGILQVLRKLKDGNSNYLWSRGTTASEPDLINGYPYFLNADMQATVATATKTVLFGQLRQYKVRQVNDTQGIRLQRLVERRAEYDEDQFIAYLRGDGGLLDAGDNPVKHLLQA